MKYNKKLIKIKKLLAKPLNDIRKCPQKLILFLAVYVILNWLWGFEAAFFLGLFFLFLIYKWESRIFIAFGLLFLASCPFYLIQRKLASAEQAAIYAYYFLVLGVILQLVEYVREKKSEKK